MAAKRLVCSALAGKAEEKNYLCLSLRNYAYVSERDVFKLLRRLRVTRLLPTSQQAILPFLHCNVPLTRNCAIVHLFNRISLGKTPWIVTHESRLPRWGFRTHWQDTRRLGMGIKLLQGATCKKILAMSRCAYNVQALFINQCYPSLRDEILAKMEVFHPPQAPLINDYSEKSLSNQHVTFTVVGHEFFRKGGLPLIRTFDHLLQEDFPVELNIISSLSGNASGVTDADIAYVRHVIAKYPRAIHYFSKLPGHEVMRVLRDTHVALLPTLDDTYGYSVLEAQANGCPVISTNVRALPEINSNEVGWMIDLPLDGTFFCAKGFLSWARGNTDGASKEVERLIEDGLVQAITDIISNPEKVRQKGTKALEQIRKSHDPQTKARALERIYDAALGA